MPSSGLSTGDIADHLKQAEELLEKLIENIDKINGIAEKKDKIEELKLRIQRSREEPDALNDTKYGELMADLLLLLPGYDYLPDGLKKIVTGILRAIGFVFDDITQKMLGITYRAFLGYMDIEGGPSEENAKKAAKKVPRFQHRLWLLWKWRQEQASQEETDNEEPSEDEESDYIPLTEEERMFLKLYYLSESTAGPLTKWLRQIKAMEDSGIPELEKRAKRQKESFGRRVDELIKLFEDLIEVLLEDLETHKKTLKVHPKIGMNLDQDQVELTGYVAAFDPDGTTEIWSNLAGSKRMRVATEAIIDSSQDESGYTRLTLAGATAVNLVNCSNSEVTAKEFTSRVQGSMGPQSAMQIGTDKFGRPIYVYTYW